MFGSVEASLSEEWWGSDASRVVSLVRCIEVFREQDAGEPSFPEEGVGSPQDKLPEDGCLLFITAKAIMSGKW